MCCLLLFSSSPVVHVLHLCGLFLLFLKSSVTELASSLVCCPHSSASSPPPWNPSITVTHCCAASVDNSHQHQTHTHTEKVRAKETFPLQTFSRLHTKTAISVSVHLLLFDSIWNVGSHQSPWVNTRVCYVNSFRAYGCFWPFLVCAHAQPHLLTFILYYSWQLWWL